MLSERTNGFAQHLAIEPVLGLKVVIYCGLIDASLGREGADTGGFLAASSANSRTAVFKMRSRVISDGRSFPQAPIFKLSFEMCLG